MRKLDMEVFWHLVGEVAGATLILVLFWDVVLERMFGLPNMNLFQAFCVVMFGKALVHLL